VERAGSHRRRWYMAGQFLVKSAPRSRKVRLFIHPFNGRTLPRQECAKILAEMYGETLEVRPSFFEPAGKRQILARILNNLKGLYMSRGDLPRALAASDRIVLADPHLTAEWRDRGLIEYQLRRDTQALQDFSRYLAVLPRPEDAPRIHQLRKQLVSRLN